MTQKSPSVKDAMTAKLETALAPLFLEVIDESDQHAGHMHNPGGGETHFRIKLVSASFSGKSRIDRHRAINALVAEDLRAGVHALAIDAKSPKEAGL